MNKSLQHRHIRLCRDRRRFTALFGVDLMTFYKDLFVGFDILAFESWLIQQDEQYRKANIGEAEECSMSEHILAKYGEEAERLVRSFLKE